MAERRATGATDDPLWLVAFPIYYLYMMAYGVFAAVYFIPSIHHVTANPLGAQTFGVVIAAVCGVALVGCLRSSKSGKVGVEFVGHVAVVLVMLIYFLAITYAVYAHDAGTRPGSAFVPQMFAVFPAVRVAVLIRRHKVLARRR